MDGCSCDRISIWSHSIASKCDELRQSLLSPPSTFVSPSCLSAIVRNFYLMKARLAALLASCVSLFAADTIYVSTTGNDSANGLSSSVSAKDGPVASLQSALDRATEHKAREIQILPGRYELNAPVEVTPQHS